MKKYALIGGPCSGKTTLIKEAKKRGIPVVSEVARDIITANRGYPSDREGIIDIQRKIFTGQIKREDNLDTLLFPFGFLDRGAVDNVAYARYYFGCQ
jgi:predicted ATPase